MPLWPLQREDNAPQHSSVKNRHGYPFFRRLNWSVLLLLGLTLPAAAQEQTSAAQGLCQSMGFKAVLAISGGVLIAIVLSVGLIYWRLQRGGWSLANAASEPTTLCIPLDENWTQSLGDRQSLQGIAVPKGPVISVTVIEASSSRLIALAGMVAILFMYVGFGIFSLYTYGITCQMPASAVAVTTFLYSGLTLFAPYVANKVSGLLQPLRSTPPLPPETEPAVPERTPNPAPPQPLPQLPAVSSAAQAQTAVDSRVATRAAAVSPAHRIAAATVKAAVAAVEPATPHAIPAPSSTEAPSGGGHWTVVIGYDDTGVIMNDPYGSCDLVNGGYPANHNGAHQHYSYVNWEPRWRPQGSGGWYLVAQR